MNWKETKVLIHKDLGRLTPRGRGGGNTPIFDN